MIPPLRVRAVSSFLLALLAGGCASIRVTDPPRSATEQYLESQAVEKAVAQLSVDALRDRVVFVDAQFLPDTCMDRDRTGSYLYQKNPEYLFLAAEVRHKLLNSGVRLVETREDAQIVVELRSPRASASTAPSSCSACRRSCSVGRPATPICRSPRRNCRS